MVRKNTSVKENAFSPWSRMFVEETVKRIVEDQDAFLSCNVDPGCRQLKSGVNPIASRLSPVVELCKQFQGESNGCHQLTLLKKTIQHFRANMFTLEDIEIKGFVHTFSLVLVHSKPKHPVRSTLRSYLKSLPSSMKDMHEVVLNKHVLEYLMKDNAEDLCRLKVAYQQRLKAELIATLLDDVDIGNNIIKRNLREVLDLLHKQQDILIKFSREASTHEEESLLMMDCLFTFKTTVSVLSDVTSTLDPDVLTKLLNQAVDVVKDDCFLLDCRIGAGLLIPEIVHQALDQTRFHALYTSLVTRTFSFGKCDLPNKVEQFINLLSELSRDNNSSLVCHLCILHGILCKGLDFVLHLNLLQPCNSVHSSNYESLYDTHLLNNIIEVCRDAPDKSSVVSAFRSLALWCSKLLILCRNQREDAILKRYSVEGPIFIQVFDVLLNFLGHPIDAVRHQVRSALKSLFAVVRLVSDATGPFHALFTKFYSSKLLYRENFMVLICLIDEVTVRELPMYEELPQQLLERMSNVDLYTYACQLYVQAALKDSTTISDTDSVNIGWTGHWIKPLFHRLSDQNEQIKIAISEIVLPQLIRECKNARSIFEHWVDNFYNDRFLCTIPIMIRLYISSELQHNCATSKFSWTELIKGTVIKKCLTHVDDQIRFDTFSLLCKPCSSTTTITLRELCLIRFFLEYNMNNQSPRLRHVLCSNVKSFIHRVETRLAKIYSGTQKSVSIEINLEKKEEEEDCVIFLLWLKEYLFSSLLHSNSYPTVSTSLILLESLMGILKTLQTLGGNRSRFTFDKSLFGANEVKGLISCLFHNYEAVKSRASELLCGIPLSSWNDFPDIVVSLCSDCFALLSSPIPDDCATGSYMFRVVAKSNAFHRQGTQALISKVTPSDVVVNYDSDSVTLGFKLLVDILLTEIQTARKSLVAAARRSPMHGALSALRLLLKDIPVGGFMDNKALLAHSQRLLQALFQLFDIVSPAVTTLAPEGYVTEELVDHNIVVNDMLSTIDLVPTDDSFSLTEAQSQKSQMLLVCCWRTMKEVCLLLGEICSIHLENLKAAPDAEDHLLTFNEVVKIGDLFLGILSSSRHIGAFELAYTGFVKICYALWRSSDSNLGQLPSSWIDGILKELSTDLTAGVFCVTRRSAGLPFYIQAICITEPEVNLGCVTKKAFKALTEICRDVTSLNKCPSPRQVISINILRALFRESKLGDDAFTFVSHGFRIAIEGSKSSIWAVRNSCSLLFSALIGRVFGVKKTRKTGREFFSRFPEMFDLLLKELEGITAAEKKSVRGKVIKLYPTTYPVLLLLSHLYSSTVDGRDSSMCLTRLIPYVQECGVSPIVKTRVMAARALASLITPDLLESVISSTLSSLQAMLDSGRISHNAVHGKLLQVEKLLEKTPRSTFQEPIYVNVFNKLLCCSQILLRESACVVTKSLWMQIICNHFFADLIQAMTRKPEDNCKALNELIMGALLPPLFDNEAVVQMIGASEWYSMCTRMFLRILYSAGLQSTVVNELIALISSAKDSLETDTTADVYSFRTNTVMNLLSSPRPEVKTETLKFLREESISFKGTSILTFLIRDFMSRRHVDRTEHYELARLLSTIGDLLPSCQIQGFDPVQTWQRMKENMVNFGNSDELIFSYLKLTGHLIKWAIDDKTYDSSLFGHKTYFQHQQILGLLAYQRRNLLPSNRLCGRLPQTSGILPSVSPQIHTNGRTHVAKLHGHIGQDSLGVDGTKCISEISNFLRNALNPDEIFTRREAVALVYKDSLLQFMKEKVEDFEDDTLVKLLLVVFTLLQDEDRQVRSITSTAVHRVLNESELVEEHSYLCDLDHSHGLEPTLATDLMLGVIDQMLSQRNRPVWLHLILNLVFGEELLIAKTTWKDPFCTAMDSSLPSSILKVAPRSKSSQDRIILFETEEKNSYAEGVRLAMQSYKTFLGFLKRLDNVTLKSEFKIIFQAFLWDLDLLDFVQRVLISLSQLKSRKIILRNYRRLVGNYLFLKMVQSASSYLALKLEEDVDSEVFKGINKLENLLSVTAFTPLT